MKIIAMIPARLGSKRVPKKNIRNLNGIPLISYIVRAVKESGRFDEIYINSESSIFEKIAEQEGVKFYKRPQALASDSATNDAFALDFIENVECDVLIQALSTSPFITANNIKDFVDKMVNDSLESLISVSNHQIECTFNSSGINFDKLKPTPPSQLLKPIQSYACGLMGWNTSVYKSNMNRFGCAYHGGDGKTGFFELSGYAIIDIDNEEDFQLAESVARSLSSEKISPTYFGDNASNDTVEVEVPDILKKDGVIENHLDEANKFCINLRDVFSKFDGKSSWSYRLVNTENNSATIISQMPGEGNRLHYHPSWNEWWLILDGEWKWEIEGEVKTVVKGDVVFIPAGKKHKITAAGISPAVRLAVSRADVPHVYPGV